MLISADGNSTEIHDDNRRIAYEGGLDYPAVIELEKFQWLSKAYADDDLRSRINRSRAATQFQTGLRSDEPAQVFPSRAIPASRF